MNKLEEDHSYFEDDGDRLVTVWKGGRNGN